MEIRKIESKTDERQVIDLFAKVFSGGGYYNSLSLKSNYVRAPWTRLDRNCTAIAVEKGEVVGHVGVLGYSKRIGSSHIRCGGIGGVAVEPRFRKKGVATRLFEAIIANMLEHGYDVSMLFGIPDFYHRFGYAPCLTHCEIITTLRDHEPSRSGLRLRVATKKDIPKLAKFYDTDNAGRTGTLVRGERDWLRVLKCRHHLVLRGSRCVGYIRCDGRGKSLYVHELAVEPKEAILAGVVELCLQRTAKERRAELCFNIPLDSPMAGFLQTQNCKTIQHHSRSGGPQGRMINVPQCLDRISGELSRRVERSAFAAKSLKLAVKTDAGSALLTLARGKVAVRPGEHSAPLQLSCPQQTLMKLVIGHGRPLRNLCGEKVGTKGDVGELLEALFPEGRPFLWEIDHY